VDVLGVLDELIALQAEGKGRFTRKGDKRPLWEVEAMKASRRAGVARKRAAAAAKAVERQAARRRAAPQLARLGERILDRMASGMDPGAWYGRLDLVRMAGGERYARGKVLQAWRAGWLERTANPGYRPRGELAPEGGWLTVEDAQWLYRLTEAGEALREAVRLLA
jgi:hypothetical protein